VAAREDQLTNTTAPTWGTHSDVDPMSGIDVYLSYSEDIKELLDDHYGVLCIEPFHLTQC